MNGDETARQDLDARLRRAMSGLDARAGFEQRLQARIAAGAPPRPALRAELEARRLAARRRLRREAWANGITTAGVGLGIAALVLRFAPEIEGFAEGVMAAAGPLTIGGATLGVLALALWPYLRNVAGLRLG